MTVVQTSLMAYANIYDFLSDRERDVLAVIQNGGDWSNQEIAKKLGWEICSVTGRTNSLRKKNVIEFGEKRHCTVKPESTVQTYRMKIRSTLFPI